MDLSIAVRDIGITNIIQSMKTVPNIQDRHIQTDCCHQKFIAMRLWNSRLLQVSIEATAVDPRLLLLTISDRKAAS